MVNPTLLLKKLNSDIESERNDAIEEARNLSIPDKGELVKFASSTPGGIKTLFSIINQVDEPVIDESKVFNISIKSKNTKNPRIIQEPSDISYINVTVKIPIKRGVRLINWEALVNYIKNLDISPPLTVKALD